MKLNEWVENVHDGHIYRLVKITPEGEIPWRLSLQCSADYSMPAKAARHHPLDRVWVAPESIVEVEDSAFNDWQHMSAFAAEVGQLLHCEPQTIVRAIG